MPWTKPEFEEINLSGEVTAYVNADDQVIASEHHLARTESAADPSEGRREISV